MRKHRIVLLPGDGIGPEITAVTKSLLETVSKKNDFKLFLIEHLKNNIGVNELDAIEDVEAIKKG